MAFKASKNRLEEAIAYVQDNLTLDPYKDEIIEALQYTIDNYGTQNKEAYIATLEAKVYTYEMIIAKSNFRSMLDPTRNNKPNNNRQNNRQNGQSNQRNNQRGNNRSALGQRSQRRSQYRNQDGTYRVVNPKKGFEDNGNDRNYTYDNGTDEGEE